MVSQDRLLTHTWLRRWCATTFAATSAARGCPSSSGACQASRTAPLRTARWLSKRALLGYLSTAGAAAAVAGRNDRTRQRFKLLRWCPVHDVRQYADAARGTRVWAHTRVHTGTNFTSWSATGASSSSRCMSEPSGRSTRAAGMPVPCVAVSHGVALFAPQVPLCQGPEHPAPHAVVASTLTQQLSTSGESCRTWAGPKFIRRT